MSTHEEIFKKIESIFGENIYLTGINIPDKNNDLSIKIDDEFSKNKNDRISVIVLGKGNYVKCKKDGLNYCEENLKQVEENLKQVEENLKQVKEDLNKCNNEKFILYGVLSIFIIILYFRK